MHPKSAVAAEPESQTNPSTGRNAQSTSTMSDATVAAFGTFKLEERINVIADALKTAADDMMGLSSKFEGDAKKILLRGVANDYWGEAILLTLLDAPNIKMRAEMGRALDNMCKAATRAGLGTSKDVEDAVKVRYEAFKEQITQAKKDGRFKEFAETTLTIVGARMAEFYIMGG